MIKITHNNIEEVRDQYTTEIIKSFEKKRAYLSRITTLLSLPETITEKHFHSDVKQLLAALKVYLGTKELKLPKKYGEGQTATLIYHLNLNKISADKRSKCRKTEKLREFNTQLDFIFKGNRLLILLSSRADQLKTLNAEFASSQKLSTALYNYFFNYQHYYHILNTYIAYPLGLVCCPYCNRNYISSIVTIDMERVIGPTYDHYFHKDKYRFLTLSFYNLIPSCYVCNSNLKGTDDFDLATHLYPYDDEFGDMVKFDFDLGLINSGKSREIIFEPKITCNPTISASMRYKLYGGSTNKHGSIKVFKLEEIYKSHFDTVEEIHAKFDQNSKHYLASIQELLDLLKVTEQDFYRFHFNNYYNIQDFHLRPLAKLTRDIYDKMKSLQ